MNIFMTDIAGPVSRRIIHFALEQKHKICALCNNIHSDSKPNPAVKYVSGDILNTASYKDAMQDCDALIHSAGLEPVWLPHTSDYRRMNVAGTRAVMQTAAQCGIKRMIHTSSCFALGPTTEKPANEDWLNQNGSGFNPTHYSRSKSEADQWLRGWLRDGHDVILLYPVMIYGPGVSTQSNYIAKLMNYFIKRRLYSIPGSGSFRWTFSYVDDVAKGHIQALENGKAGSRYILGGEDVTLLELFEMLEAVTKLKPPRMKKPISLLRLVASIEQWRAQISSGYTPTITPDTFNMLQQHWRFSSQKAIAEIGYTRTPLKVGIIKTVDSLGFSSPSDRESIL